MSQEHVPASLQRRVRERAGNRCEDCRIAQVGQEATFHIDHVRPRSEGGPTRLDNLALACVSCSLRKGARVEVRDPETGAAAAVFNPRADAWDDHFQLTPELQILGTTAVGRGTVAQLRMNRTLAVAIRREEAERGRYP